MKSFTLTVDKPDLEKSVAFARQPIRTGYITTMCPLAMALKRKFGEDKNIGVGFTLINIDEIDYKCNEAYKITAKADFDDLMTGGEQIKPLLPMKLKFVKI